MEQELLPGDFLTQSCNGVIIDVRTPAEFMQGHIPGALNIPLFTDSERVVVGTLYLHEGKDVAVEKGLEFVGPRMAALVREAKKVSEGKILYVHCWRGGMRSASMAWLFRTAGLKAVVLKGGYKAYRQSFAELLQLPWKLLILGGPTGCGKTDILHALRQRGEQILDLEGLANHKGSAFGALGQEPQPTTEQFQNNLHHTFRSLDPDRWLWSECESLSIGKVFLPQELFNKMLAAPFIYLYLPLSCRIERLLKEYGNFSEEELIASFRKIERKLGGERTTQAIKLLEDKKIAEASAIALQYYDKSYTKSFNDRWHVTYTYHAEDNDVMHTADQLQTLIKEKLINNARS